VKSLIPADVMSPARKRDTGSRPANSPHHLYLAIDAVAETDWSNRDEFEAEVLQTERQIEVHLNEIILESVSLLKSARARHKVLEEACAHQAEIVTAYEALRDRALEKRQELLEELELAVQAAQRGFCQVSVTQ
jgi:hypothetical protein